MISVISSLILFVIIYFSTNVIFSFFETRKVNNFLNNMSYTKKFKAYIYEFEKSYNKKVKFISLINILIFSFILSVIVFVSVYSFVKIVSTALIIAIFSFFLPYFFVKYLVKIKKQQILNIFPTYAVNLKNYTKIDNDIVIAFRKTKTSKPLSLYIDKFNLSVEKGLNVYEAFNELKNDINIKSINDFLTAAQYSYLNGGNFNQLLDKYSKILVKANIQREKEKQESFSSKFILFLLIIINIYILFIFIFSNEEYRSIMFQTNTGKFIINLNIISYIFIFYFIHKLNEMEE